MLGTGVHHAQVRERGGGALVADLEWSSLRYGRALDDMTDAEVVVSLDALAAAELAGLEAWRHELVIYREPEPGPTWVGPLHLDPHYGTDSITVRARDGFAWFERRVLMVDMEFDGDDLAVIFERIAEAALAQDPSPNISVVARPTGVEGTRSVVGVQRRRAADELRELADTGVDWTFVGRRMLVGGEEVPTDASVVLTDDDVDDPQIDPAEPATMVSAVGANVDGVPLVADVGGVDALRGLVHVVVSAPGIQDQDSLEAFALAHYELLREAQNFVTAALTPQASPRLADLVPGVRVRLAMGQLAREADVDLRLQAVEVSAQQTEEGETETVRVSLAPLGRVDALA